MNYVAFDIETLGTDPRAPDGITCAATKTSDGVLRLWHPSAILPDGRYADRMSEQDIGLMISHLGDLLDGGFRPVAWNGCSFDFRVLHHFAPDELKQVVIALCQEHYDPALHMLSEKGFMCGLDAASAGMRASGKLHEMDGQTAASEWTQSHERQDLILRYVGQDSTTTAEVFSTFVRVGALTWLTKSGKLSQWSPFDHKPLTVKEVLAKGFVGRPSWWSGDEYPWTVKEMIGWMQ